jgi:YegS/Rv2252/BmrU family lipid kinase
VTAVAVIAHSGKTMGGGLLELRHALEAEGIADPQWFEVPKSRKAPKRVKEALDNGAELIFVWGGDGMVQRCVDALAGSHATLAILPAGTANLFATNLGIPQDVAAAVEIGLRGSHRMLDSAVFNGEHFAVMAGVGYDARMIRDASGGLKDKLGRVGYIWTGAKNLRLEPFKATIRVDGAHWYRGKASCILVGNVGSLMGGIEVFPDARPDDGKLELGVVTADGLVQWARTLARTAAGTPSKSPYVQTTTARSVKIELNRKVLYELDGGDRTKTKSLEIEVHPASIRVCVPATPELAPFPEPVLEGTSAQ